jgi:hypothetical protein
MVECLFFFSALLSVSVVGGEVCSNGHGGEEGACYRCLVLERLTNKNPCS